LVRRAKNEDYAPRVNCLADEAQSSDGFDVDRSGPLFVRPFDLAIRASDWRCGVVDDDVQSIETAAFREFVSVTFDGAAKKLAKNLKALASEALEASLKNLEIADGKVREFAGNLITSSRKLASMLYREHVCVKVGNPLLTLLCDSKVA